MGISIQSLCHQHKEYMHLSVMQTRLSEYQLCHAQRRCSDIPAVPHHDAFVVGSTGRGIPGSLSQALRTHTVMGGPHPLCSWLMPLPWLKRICSQVEQQWSTHAQIFFCQWLKSHSWSSLGLSTGIPHLKNPAADDCSQLADCTASSSQTLPERLFSKVLNCRLQAKALPWNPSTPLVSARSCKTSKPIAYQSRWLLLDMSARVSLPSLARTMRRSPHSRASSSPGFRCKL